MGGFSKKGGDPWREYSNSNPNREPPSSALNPLFFSVA
jgi:hypothetical protein